MEKIYPIGPQSVPVELSQPSKQYKQHAWIALASLALFVTIYIALASWFVLTAKDMLTRAIVGRDGFWFFIIGSCSAFLAIFMLKALFFIKRGGAPDAVEVKKAEQPRLFEFLYRLADEAGAPRPNKVFISARVNAAVFYDLSILNLLFPSRKNLEIGLALVNVLTLSEIKAVLAHEFGHFAQRTMAIGSWVYIAQQIASHVVAKRDALDELLNFLSRVDIRIAWVGWILSLIVWSIRSLMDSLLRVVVLAQRALSRQMEFQADLVAVSLTGSDELVHALHKLNAADDAWGRTLSFTQNEIQQGRIPHDLFKVQGRIIEKIAHILDDDSYGKVPPASVDRPEAHRVFKSNFAQPPQMWLTHPASHDREENAKRYYLRAPHDVRSAWLLFDNVESVKSQVAAHLIGESKAAPVDEEQTFKALDERYALLQYEPRYRGAYLGRPITRHAKTAEELYEELQKQSDLRQEFESLYSQQLAADLTRLRDLHEEKAMLEALHEKIYRATGGRIVFRGREIKRSELPSAISVVSNEIATTENQINSHDRQCRSVHLKAARQLGLGWPEYLLALINLLHYAEHTLADLRDAQGLLSNVFAIVTADGKISSDELTRLISTANILHGVLTGVFNNKTQVKLDETLCARLGVKSWEERLEEYKLPPATRENANDWFKAIDGWVESAASALAALVRATLEQLLQTEEQLAQHIREQTTPAQACVPSVVPTGYPTLLPGTERKRQKQLDWWDRFQTSDGLIPGVTRLVVAGAIVGTVLGFGSLGSFIGTPMSTVSVYNGLGISVSVSAGKQTIQIAAYSANSLRIDPKKTITIETHSADGRLIESLTPPLSGAYHYVYNVASASPLIEWTAVYGNARESQPQFLGAPQWTTAYVDDYFSEPPASVKSYSKGGGVTRRVLSGVGDESPEKILELVPNPEDRRRVINAHATWDSPDRVHASQWRELANQIQ